MVRGMLPGLGLVALCLCQTSFSAVAAEDSCPATQDPLSSWSVDKVAEWLKELAVKPEIIAAFVENDMDGAAVSQITDDDLRDELGVNVIGQRKRIMREKAKLMSCEGIPTSAPPAASQSRAAAPAAQNPKLQGLTDQLMAQGINSVPDNAITTIFGMHLNSFNSAVSAELNELGVATDWPSIKELVPVSADLRLRLATMGLAPALQQRAKITNRLLAIKKQLWANIAFQEDADIAKPGSMYAKPNTPTWRALSDVAGDLKSWLAIFPEDLAGQLWANRVALARADFDTVNSTMASAYSLAQAWAKHLCSARPIAVVNVPMGTPHGNRAQEIQFLSEECRHTRVFLGKVAEEWASLVILAARDGIDVDQARATFDSFAIRQQSYVDRDDVLKFLTGPGIYASDRVEGTRSGLRHYKEQMLHLAEVMEGTPACGAAGEAPAADIATAGELQTRFAGNCKSVAQKLKAISASYGRALKLSQETNTAWENSTFDMMLMPAGAIKDISGYMKRNLHLDPAGAMLPDSKSVLSAPPGSKKWLNIQEDKDEVLVVDNVFSQDFIEKIRLFTERSTVFHAQKPMGYQCAYMQEGYAPPLMAQ
ncbi:unnamed protein product, partial [Polarella glacialis]